MLRTREAADVDAQDPDHLIDLTLVRPTIVGATISVRSRFSAVRFLAILCDGKPWATVPTFPRDGGDGITFSCQLPMVDRDRSMRVEARNAETQEVLGHKAFDVGPLYNSFGLSAALVLDGAHGPLMSMLGLSFDGVKLVISGGQLPPNGDPSQLRVEFDAGVAYTVEYPLPSPDFETHYWYWPNAGLSGIRITVDLLACAPGADPFRFRLVYPDLESLGGEARRKQAATALVPTARTVYIPSNLSSFIGFPGNITQLTRVQGHDSPQSVTFTGYSVFRALEAIMARHGIRASTGTTVLDWGCGHGRVTRHFIQNWQDARISGVDIDAENAAWCNENLPDGTFSQVPLWPPTSLKAASFDVIFGISVMTHLTAEAQQAWLEELARLLKPGGLALLSFAGPGAVAFSSFWRDRPWWDAWLRSGFDDQQSDLALQGKIPDATYYRNSYQMSDHVRSTYSKYLDVVAIELEQFGYQDLAILRKRT
ncbi:class I SAM-dependent methyltransferase [Lichenihabitans psoromatis]|uniref:class I SAM-dependent methyltransferase n=1 Tax=Lichenihabitans psoromatis TaxID=2528642 RepID=UPI0010384CD8|nr:methyltransferase domain-containing protein [Lichenihabitans psoromatis]